jgi:hypothetical protein
VSISQALTVSRAPNGVPACDKSCGDAQMAHGSDGKCGEVPLITRIPPCRRSGRGAVSLAESVHHIKNLAALL